ncbi:MAG: hypothetical protein H6650_10175 [Ardenticatenales bacterium]|nr:hypothetical protein [Ardenticatenales bacterium]
MTTPSAAPSPWYQRHPGWLAALAALACVFLYLWLARPLLGFPLDDAWIHQVYARNLGLTGRWEYAPGTAGSGSTSPLWTLWLALGYVLRVPFRWWAYGAGVACLAWLGGVSAALWRVLWPGRASLAWMGGLVVVFTWPLVWAAASGMETLLFAALGFTLLWQFLRKCRHIHGRTAVGMGILGGLLILTRPDGLVLLFILSVAWLLPTAGSPPRRHWGGFLLALLLTLLPYFIFNYATSHHLWPNTFYAKQAEYAALQARPLAGRVLHLLYFTLGGPPDGWRGMSAAHLLLLPGLVFAGWQAARDDWRSRRLCVALPLLWAGGHVFLYAWRLPVTFQHGRYLLPIMPVWALSGLAGWVWLLRQPALMTWRWRTVRLGWLAARVAAATFGVLLLFFLAWGGRQYRADVAFIEAEMVATAHWLRANTAPQALIAAHDIGAIGYFARRPLLDLAGLVSPQLTPLLHDENLVARYVVRGGADYLVTAPGWTYAVLTEDSSAVTLVFQTDYAWTRQQGLNNMEVYELRPAGSGLP